MGEKILIVDDIELNREILAVALGDTYPVLEAGNGNQAIEILREHSEDIAAILLDLIMPEKDGYAVLQFMKESELLESIPVLVISAESKTEVERECLELGVSEFIRKPFDSVTVRSRVKNIVDLFKYKNRLEEKVRIQTDNLKRQNKLLEQQTIKIKENNENIIDVLGTVVEYRNLESGEHIKRVKGFTRILAERAAQKYPEYSLTPEKIDIIVAASALHDIGKITIRDSVLLKPGRLDKDEFEYMKSHTVKGCDILEQIDGAWDDEYVKVSRAICRYHHERYDGKGYPDGLIGEKIPLEAQLVSVADVYDALVSERIYKDAIEKEKAYHMILMGECGVFSPKLMECFRESKEEFEALARKYEMIHEEYCDDSKGML